MSDVLNVEKRELFGSANSRRLRRDGLIPAILYGHGKECVPLTVSTDQITAVMRHGARLVELKGGVSDTAFLKDVQMDALGSRIVHVDLTRIEAGESVEVTVAIEFRGVAPGTKQGGVVEHGLHEVTILCPATSIPERIEVSINDLEFDQQITAGDLVLPKGAELLTDPALMVVACAEPAAELDDELLGPSDGAEPEVIGRKEGDEATGE